MVVVVVGGRGDIQFSFLIQFRAPVALSLKKRAYDAH
jgi:hypothetical protein